MTETLGCGQTSSTPKHANILVDWVDRSGQGHFLVVGYMQYGVRVFERLPAVERHTTVSQEGCLSAIYDRWMLQVAPDDSVVQLY